MPVFSFHGFSLFCKKEALAVPLKTLHANLASHAKKELVNE